MNTMAQYVTAHVLTAKPQLSFISFIFYNIYVIMKAFLNTQSF